MSSPFNPSEHPHRRLNALSGQWILCSPHRASRPWQGQVEKKPVEELQSYDKDCYLCPRNKRVNGDHVNPDYQDTFAFTNDFSALLKDSPGTPPAAPAAALAAALFTM